MNDTINDGLNAIKERLTGPLGYISISFILYNWSWFYYVIFSDKLAEVKIASVIKFFPIHSGFLYPILFGSAMTLLMPFIAAWIKKATYKAKIIAKKAEKDEEDYAEDYSLDKKVARVQKEYEATVKTAEIERIKNERDELSAEILQHQKSIEALSLQEATLRSSILTATQEKHDLDYSNSKLKIEIGEIERLKTELNLLSEWNQTYQNAAEVNNNQLIDLATAHEKLALLSNAMKKIPNWGNRLSKEEIENITRIIDGTNS